MTAESYDENAETRKQATVAIARAAALQNTMRKKELIIAPSSPLAHSEAGTYKTNIRITSATTANCAKNANGNCEGPALLTFRNWSYVKHNRAFRRQRPCFKPPQFIRRGSVPKGFRGRRKKLFAASFCVTAMPWKGAQWHTAKGACNRG